MRTPRFLVLSCVLVYGSAVLAQTDRETGNVAPVTWRPIHPPSPAHPIRAFLDKSVEVVAWDDAPLREVIEWLRTLAEDNVNVVVRWRALNDEGIDRDTEVSLELRHTTVGEVLRVIFDLTSDEDPLSYQGTGTILTIGTESSLGRKLYTRVYNLSEIVSGIRSHSGAPQIHLEEATGGGLGGANGQSQAQPMFSAPDADDREDGEDTDAARAERIVALIRSTVEPDTWAANGGRGTIEIFDRQLVVRNTIRVHEVLGGSFRFDE